ncbi:MAG TPA: GAF domain-containing protein [Streptosporangiaceae bacterium]
MTHDRPPADLTFDTPPGQLLTPDDREAPRRVVRLRELGLGERPDVEFDGFAWSLAESARTLTGASDSPYAMVNFISRERQYFAGLFVAVQPPADSSVVAGSATGVQVGREMGLDYGFCPHVVVRRRPLVLEDVCDYPRFAGNPVVDQVGIRSYLGAPLIDRTGVTLGTICVVDTEPRPWGRAGLDLIKARAVEMIGLIHDRERRPAD